MNPSTRVGQSTVTYRPPPSAGVVLYADDLAEDIEDVDFTEGDEGWETEDEGGEEMEEADKDDSDLTFSKHTGSVFCVNLDPSTNSLAVTGGEDDRSFVWRGECKTFQGPGCQATTGKILPDGKRAVVGYEDGIIRLWDLKQGNTSHVLKGPDGHQGPVTCMACSKDGGLILTGSVDCRAKLISTATGKVVGVFSTEGCKPKVLMEEESETNSIESVGFCNVLPLVAVAYLDGTLAIYDLSTQSLRHKCPHEAGIVHLQWEDSSPLLYTCSLDGAVRIWDARSGQMVTQYCGHTAEILDFTLNREATVAVTASGDHKAKVFCLQRPGRLLYSSKILEKLNLLVWYESSGQDHV
ncbi:UNVERIFIED_CONTAM: hypothetical protein FKN15_047765 [Acipenser sinensis]